MTADNVLNVLNRATDDDKRNGASWYTEAHALAMSLGNLYTGAGVIAALSPQNSWVINQRLAKRAFADGYASGSLGSSCLKATRILNGESPLDVLGGDKVRNFYANIVSPHGDAVTIDRHAWDAANGVSSPGKNKQGLGRKGEYERYADMYRDAAKLAGIAAPTLQAIVWVTWRREKGLTWAG